MQRIKIFKNEKVLRRNCYGSKGWLDSVCFRHCLRHSCKSLGSSGPPASASLAMANGGIPPCLVLITLVKTHQISSAQDIKVFFF